MAKAKKHQVKFEAHKTVKKPVEVKFKTKKGTLVDFEARKPVKKVVHVKFKARDK
ncbi:MAG TPA: hypothetical protein VK557_21155 [Pyrinomonadaceae bacterium]|nr:hypothetical protein [Pyrinomonadaceae bacterium]